MKMDLPYSLKSNILALGAQSKGGFCLVKNGKVYLSNSYGDLSDLENFHKFERQLKKLKVKPKIVACDLHPEYISTKLARGVAKAEGVTLKTIQHHEAHVASCMVDNNIRGEVIGIAFDGTGFGRDGNIWGGEFFVGSLKGLRRAAHLRYIPMPGGEQAVREPWRMALSYLYNADLPIPARLDKAKVRLLMQMIDRGINSPLTSSIGRFFDAVSSMIGICDVAKYEGEAAIELEKVLDARCSMLDARERYKFGYKNGIIDWTPVIKDILRDVQAKKSKAEISLKFHSAVCYMIKDVCNLLRKKYRINKVCMSGGVFQNRYLTENTPPILEKQGFEVYLHKNLPAHDGNIALGQAALAANISRLNLARAAKLT